jgi:DNA-3-methyladenine glycosylase
MRTGQRLHQDFYLQATTEVARNLLGKAMVRQLDGGETLAGIVVEVEAYLPADDRASHSFRGLGRKNASMFEPAGTLYVYPIHAKFCLNVVTEAKGNGAAVLIRAIQPIQGLTTMHELRGLKNVNETLTRLTTGPARLCQALAVDRSLDGADLLSSSSIWFESEPSIVAALPWTARTSARIGISQAVDKPLRWFIDGHQFVSGCARDHSRRRDWCFAFP